MGERFPIKVYGITRLEDARLAADLGAMALGFIFYPKSPRFIAPEAVGSLLNRLNPPSALMKVGVFVNADKATLLYTKKVAGLDVLQLHGDETPEFCAELAGHRLWKAIRLKNEQQLEELPAFEKHVEAFLFDAAVDGAYGGTGHTVKTELLEKIPRNKPILIAGGMTPENWQAVYDLYHPWAIDLSSGVESGPGIKDPQKLTQLFSKRGNKNT